MRLRLPATSANLGPGFDAVGLALDLWLTVEAEAAESFSIRATGRNARACEDVAGSLVLRTYRDVCAAAGVHAVPVAMVVDNGIPFGMGLGSSAAAILAGVLLAVRFGGLQWSAEQMVARAAELEGHADNVAACWFGGLTMVATDGAELRAWSSIPAPEGWTALVVLPASPVATAKARGVLPGTLSRADAVYNLQRTALLAAAFARGDGALLRVATGDRMHQPYRGEICPLLPRLLPLREDFPEVLSVTLSGAGPSVLMLLQGEASYGLEERVRALAEEPVELLRLALACSGAEVR